MSPGPSPRLAVVTGASAGIGLALARELAREGWQVLAVARREDRLRALAEEARAVGWPEIHPFALDVTGPGAPERLAARAQELGGASLLVNNAGFGQYGRFERANPARLAAMLRTNCEALVLLTHAFLPQLRASGAGAVLNVASAAAFQPTPYMAVYGATKAFVLSFSEGLAEELRGGGVWVGAFCPGPVETEFGEVSGGTRHIERQPGKLTAEEAARGALAQLRGRDVVLVPSTVYKITAAASRLLPRALLRRVSGRMHRPREGS